MNASDLSKIAAKLPLSESVRKLNSIGEAGQRIVAPEPQVPRISTVEDNLNKTEKRFLNELRSRGYQNIGIQRITLRLAFDTRYTPDFDTGQDIGHTFWEVKGFMRDDARVKLYTAAAMFPYWTFVLVEWENGAWTETIVRP